MATERTPLQARSEIERPERLETSALKVIESLAAKLNIPEEAESEWQRVLLLCLQPVPSANRSPGAPESGNVDKLDADEIDAVLALKAQEIKTQRFQKTITTVLQRIGGSDEISAEQAKSLVRDMLTYVSARNGYMNAWDGETSSEIINLPRLTAFLAGNPTMEPIESSEQNDEEDTTETPSDKLPENDRPEEPVEENEGDEKPPLTRPPDIEDFFGSDDVEPEQNEEDLLVAMATPPSDEENFESKPEDATDDEEVLEEWQPDPDVKDIDPARIEAALSNVDDLRSALKIPEENAEGWRYFCDHLNKPIPSPENAKDVPSAEEITENPGIEGVNRLRFLRKRHENLLRLKNGAVEMLELFNQVAAYEGEDFDEAERSVLLEQLTSYWNAYETYVSAHNNEDRRDEIPMVARMYVTELVEEGTESIMPLGKQWQSEFMRGLDARVAKETLRVRSQLLRAGVKRTPTLMKVLGKSAPAAGFMKEILKGARPDSYFTIVLYAYYVHNAEDKGEAAVQFASFMMTSGLSNAALTAATNVLVNSNNARLAALGKIPGHPLVKIAVAIGLSLGVDYLIGYDNISGAVRDKFDPATWEMIGTISDTIGGGAVVEQFGEIGYQTGLRNVDPSIDQERFLDQKILIADYSEGFDFGMNHVHTIDDWDRYVKRRMDMEPNSVLKRLWQAELIRSGPGGQEGWEQRQAVKFYRSWSALREMENRVHDLIEEFDILNVPTMIGFSHMFLQKGDEHGAIGIETILQNDMFVEKLESEIERLTEKYEDAEDDDTYKIKIKELSDTWERVQSIAKRLAERRSTYVHLDVYDPDWIKERTVEYGDDQQDVIMPQSVEKGIISLLAKESRRAEALGYDERRDGPGGTYGRRLSSILQLEKKISDEPSIIGDPIGWFKWFRQHNSEYNSREFKRWDKKHLQEFASELAYRVRSRGDNMDEVFGPLQKLIQSQNDENLYHPYMAKNALAQAYVRTRYDGRLVRKSETPKFKSWEEDRGLRNEKVIPSLYVYGNVDPEHFELSMPLRRSTRPGIISPPKKPKYDTPAARAAYAKLKAAYEDAKEHQTPGNTRSRAPVIVSTERLSQSQIDTRFDLSYDPETDEWTVETSTAVTVHMVSNLPLNPEHHSHSVSRGSFTQPFHVWAREHPEFALQISKDMEAHEQQKEKEYSGEQTYGELLALQTALEQTQELSEQEIARYEAKKKPGRWIPYPTQISRLDENDDTPSYEFVTYVPEKDAFMYLQKPRHHRNGPSVSNADPHVVKKRGNYSYPRVTYEQNGKWYRWTMSSTNEKARQDSTREDGWPVGYGYFTKAVTLPIENNDRLSIQNITSMYVEDFESNEAERVETRIMDLYEDLVSYEHKRKFLSRLKLAVQHETRALKKEGPFYARVTYKDNHQGYYLTRRMYDDKIYPVMKKYMETQLGYTFG